jgi:hypothetical protein
VDQPGTLAALSRLTSGGEVDRRTFVAASGATLTALAAQWRSALASSGPLLPVSGPRQVSPELVRHIDQRLAHLRRLDDELDSGELAGLARSELAQAANHRELRR